MLKITPQKWVMITLLAALFMRLQGLLAAMTYDEIWTLLNFTKLSFGRLFFDLELPNNHPLNSVLCKFMYALPLPIEFCRLPNLLAGIASVWLAGLIARKSWGDKAMVWAGLFMAFAPALAYYSTQARGYSLQTCWLLLYTYLLMRSVDEKPSKYSYGLIVIAALAAVATLSTSAMYLAAVTLVLWGGYNWKTPPRKTVYAVIAAAVLSAIYLLLNLQGLLSAQAWGIKISGITDAAVWLWSIFYNLLPWALLPWVVIGFYLLGKKNWRGIAAALLLLVAATVLTSPGPWRVYLPLAAFFAIIGARGAAWVQDKFSGKRCLPLAMMLAAVSIVGNGYILYNEQRPMDYFRVNIESGKLPAEVMTVYAPAETYPLYFNSGTLMLEKYAEILRNQSPERTLLLVGMPENVISGVDIDFAPCDLPLSYAGSVSTIGGVSAREFKLRKTTVPAAVQSGLIAVVTGGNYEEYLQTKQMLQAAVQPGKLLFLNLWFSNRDLPCGMFYIAQGALDAGVFEKIPAANSNRIVFYQIVP